MGKTRGSPSRAFSSLVILKRIGESSKVDDIFYSNECPFLSKREYAKIVSEINADYFTVYHEQRLAIHFSLGDDERYYAYYFINNGFNDYTFVDKLPF